MLTVKRSLITIALLLCARSSNLLANQYRDGIVGNGLAEVAHLLPAQSSIAGIQEFNDFKQSGPSLAIWLYVGRNQRLFIASPRKDGHFALVWKSDPLAESFAVSDQRHFTLKWLEEGQAIAFTGCAQHQCPDIFSALLYVPSLKKAFIGTCNNGKTEYNFAPIQSTNEIRSAVNSLLKENTGSSKACSPDLTN